MLRLIITLLFYFNTNFCRNKYCVITVVTNNTPPTANSPSVVVNNSDVCKTAVAGAVQTQILGISSGITVTDENCERIKLARSLYASGMKVASVSILCQDPRVWDSMTMAGTPCPYMGSIGEDAETGWKENMDMIPEGSVIYAKWNDEINQIKVKEGVESDGSKLANLLLLLWLCTLVSLCSSLRAECPVTASGVCTPGVEETIVITETESIEYEADGHTVTTTTTTDTTTVTVTNEDSGDILMVIMAM